MELRNLIRQVLKEEVDVKDQYAGWVNINVNTIGLKSRIERFTKSFGLGKGKLPEKLDMISNPPNNIVRLQEAMASIIILEHIKELRDNFNAATSGFLFEEVIAGLLPGETTGGVKTDFNKTDVIGYDGKKYQIKLYAGTGYVKVNYWKPDDKKVILNPDLMKENPDFIIFAMKQGNVIEIFQISFVEYKEYTLKSGLSLSAMKSISDPIGTLDTSKIDQTVKELLEETYESFSNLFKTVSDLEANLEGMITGVTEGGEKVNIKSGANKVEGDIGRLSINFEELKDKLL